MGSGRTLHCVGDAFDILGLGPTFDLDAEALRRAYLSKSSELHPDLAAGDSDAARGMALVNMARRKLEDPEQRANELLIRLGGPSKETDRALPEGFLLEIMDTRERIEAANPYERPRWEAWATDRRREFSSEIGAMFRSLGPVPDAAHLKEIRVRLNAWRYVERLIEQLSSDGETSGG